MPDLDIPTPYCAKLEAVFQLGAIVWENRWYFDSVFEDWTGPWLAELLSVGATWVINEYLPLLSNEVQFIRAKASDQSATPIPPVQAPFIGYYGGVPSPSSAVSVSATVALYDVGPGPTGVGRTLISGVPLSVVEENTFNSDWCEAVRDAFIDLIDIPIFSHYSYFCFVSYRHNKAYRSEGVKHQIDHIAVRPWVNTRRLRSKNRLRP